MKKIFKTPFLARTLSFILLLALFLNLAPIGILADTVNDVIQNGNEALPPETDTGNGDTVGDETITEPDTEEDTTVDYMKNSLSFFNNKI